MSSASLVVSGVSHAYGRFEAVRDASFAVSAGEVHCLLGASGSGKTTLLRLIAGLETLSVGSISIAGDEVAAPGVHRPPEDRAVGFVFQDYALFPHLDVRGNVAFGMASSPRAEKEAATEELLSLVGMSASAEAMPHTLSGGQQQRVAVARALARRPLVMLLDEPFSSLDARQREEVSRSTLEILRSAEVATVLVTHDAREALAVADSVSVIEHGGILQTGSPSEVYGCSRSQAVADIFGPVNRLEGTIQGGSVRTPCGDVEAEGFDEDQEVGVLIRPEHVRISGEARGTSTEGTIVEIRKRGAVWDVGVRLSGGLTLRCLELDGNGRQVGDSVFVGFELDAVMLVAAG